MKAQNSNKGVYLTPQVQFKLKEIACRYHITLKSLVPALLWYISTNEKETLFNLSAPVGARKLKHVDISNKVFDNLKIQACQHHLPLSHYINIALLDVFDEPYMDDTDEWIVKCFYMDIIEKYHETLDLARQCG